MLTPDLPDDREKNGGGAPKVGRAQRRPLEPAAVAPVDATEAVNVREVVREISQLLEVDPELFNSEVFHLEDPTGEESAESPEDTTGNDLLDSGDLQVESGDLQVADRTMAMRAVGAVEQTDETPQPDDRTVGMFPPSRGASAASPARQVDESGGIAHPRTPSALGASDTRPVPVVGSASKASDSPAPEEDATVRGQAIKAVGPGVVLRTEADRGGGGGAKGVVIAVAPAEALPLSSAAAEGTAHVRSGRAVLPPPEPRVRGPEAPSGDSARLPPPSSTGSRGASARLPPPSSTGARSAPDSARLPPPSSTGARGAPDSARLPPPSSTGARGATDSADLTPSPSPGAREAPDSARLPPPSSTGARAREEPSASIEAIRSQTDARTPTTAGARRGQADVGASPIEPAWPSFEALSGSPLARALTAQGPGRTARTLSSVTAPLMPASVVAALLAAGSAVGVAGLAFALRSVLEAATDLEGGALSGEITVAIAVLSSVLIAAGAAGVGLVLTRATTRVRIALLDAAADKRLRATGTVRATFGRADVDDFADRLAGPRTAGLLALAYFTVATVMVTLSAPPIAVGICGGALLELAWSFAWRGRLGSLAAALDSARSEHARVELELSAASSSIKVHAAAGPARMRWMRASLASSEAAARFAEARTTVRAGAIVVGGVAWIVALVLATTQTLPASVIGVSVLLTGVAGVALAQLGFIIAEGRVDGAVRARIARSLDLEPEQRDSPEVLLPVPVCHGQLTVHGVSARGDDSPVLEDLDLEIPAGALVAIVGESGSGKSALAALLAGVVEATKGSVEIDGHSRHLYDLSALRRHLAWVPEDVPLIEGTVLDNVVFGEPLDADRARRALFLAGLEPLIAKLPGEHLARVGGATTVSLSRGERQRIGLARGLYRESRILIVDDGGVLEALGTEGVETFLEHVAPGRTLVMVTQHPGVLASASQIFVMADGRVVERGTHPELVAAGGVYFDLVGR